VGKGGTPLVGVDERRRATSMGVVISYTTSMDVALRRRLRRKPLTEPAPPWTFGSYRGRDTGHSS
jgi:hypothetical protein